MRLAACASRKGFGSAVALAWKQGSSLRIACSGQLISRTLVLTADHCFDKRQEHPTVLLHFLGGSTDAIGADGQTTFKNLTEMAVTKVWRGRTQPLSSDLRGFDVALVELSAPVAMSAFPTLGTAMPKPFTMTVVGFGLSDALPHADVALEVTQISPNATVRVIDPSLRGWSAALSSGGGLCRADSGGPIFAGKPAASSASMQLIGLVAGGNLDCKSGEQVMTDLTRPETLAYVCSLGPSLPACRR
jgi:hypothetical protein